MKRIFFTLVLLTMLLSSHAQDTLLVQGSRGRLHTIVVTPPTVDVEAKVPVVVIMHGFTGNKNEPLLTGLSDALLKAGIASVRFDFNGHGASEGDFLHMNIRNEIEDAKAIIRYVRALPWAGRISVVGHSQGGVVASMVAGELDEGAITSMVLYAPAANIGDGARQGAMLGREVNVADLPETFEIWGRHLHRHYIDIARTMPMYETAAIFRGPTCIIHGDNDRIVPLSVGQRYAEICRDATLHVCRDDDHGFNRDRATAIRLGADFLIETLTK